MTKHLPFGAKEAGIGLLALQQKSALFGAVGYSFLPRVVDAQALGTEFQINNYTVGDQRNPSVAPLNDGGFFVIWESDGQDGDNYGIYGQIYFATGVPNGFEFQVNNYTAGLQWFPTVAPLKDGGFVVVWESFEQDRNGEGIYGQRYLATGARSRVKGLARLE